MPNVKPVTLDEYVTSRVPAWLKKKLAEQRLEGESQSDQIRRILIAAVVEGPSA